ncbi:MAG: hypothetical protein HOC20_00645 [Chloroflexi bacterium]|jgi:hypothetical protein|nr:hypothetical protein [Chloroflexota bacterium]
MNDQDPESEIIMSSQERSDANKFIIDHLHKTMRDSRANFAGLRTKLTITYWVMIVLSIGMFIIGIVLLSVPIVAAFRNDISGLESLTSAGFGVVDLAGLFLFRPIERIHSLMGDMSQITMALNSFRIQVGLRLIEMNSNNRATVGQAAEHVSNAAKDSINLVQDYFEGKEK